MNALVTAEIPTHPPPKSWGCRAGLPINGSCRRGACSGSVEQVELRRHLARVPVKCLVYLRVFLVVVNTEKTFGLS